MILSCACLLVGWRMCVVVVGVIVWCGGFVGGVVVSGLIACGCVGEWRLIFVLWFDVLIVCLDVSSRCGGVCLFLCFGWRSCVLMCRFCMFRVF